MSTAEWDSVGDILDQVGVFETQCPNGLPSFDELLDMLVDADANVRTATGQRDHVGPFGPTRSQLRDSWSRLGAIALLALTRERAERGDQNAWEPLPRTSWIDGG